MAAHPSPSPRKRHGILGGGLRSKPAKSKLELRREKNEARETALGELMSRKPRPDYVDPDSQAANHFLRISRRLHAIADNIKLTLNPLGTPRDLTESRKIIHGILVPDMVSLLKR